MANSLIWCYRLVVWFFVVYVNSVLSQPDPRDGFYHYAVVYPTFYTASREKRDLNSIKLKNENRLSVTFSAFNRKFNLEIWKNHFLLPSNYFEKYQENGSYVLRRPLENNPRGHCNYHGRLKGLLDSSVAISTCRGLSGQVYDGSELFFIEPDHISTNDSHYFFRAKDTKMKNFSCGVTDSFPNSDDWSYLNMTKRSVPPLENYPGQKDFDPYYIEIVALNDNKQFLRYNADKDAVFARTVAIFNIADACYSALNIHIVLLGIIIWNEKDEMEVSTDASATLSKFKEYRRTILHEHPNDNAQLFVPAIFDRGVLGMAYLRGMCSWDKSVGINADNTIAAQVALTLAHEMGHNLGINHDKPDCACVDRFCMMYKAAASFLNFRWSDCSVNELLWRTEKGIALCLRNFPKEYFPPVCGNGILEDKEECDTGSDEIFDSPCCNALNCTLTPNATCYNGECCDAETCQVREIATVCRNATSDCDLPEYCDGKSRQCPADTYRQNGEDCENDQGYCLEGDCKYHLKHCILLYGNEATLAENLFPRNTKGNEDGNCGRDLVTTEMFKCDKSQVWCGRLHCLVNKTNKFEFGAFSSRRKIDAVVQGDRYGVVMHIDLGLSEPDYGMVPNGSKCAPGKICIDLNCVSIETVKNTSCVLSCNGKGVCNNKENCHCEIGYQPPDCLSEGTGGSIDSGPASVPKITTTTEVITTTTIAAASTSTESGSASSPGIIGDTEESTSSSNTTAVALYIVFLGILPLVLILAAIAYLFRAQIQIWLSKKDQGESAEALGEESNVEQPT